MGERDHRPLQEIAWRANKAGRAKDFPIDKRSLNHPSVIALRTDRRSAEESVAARNHSSHFFPPVSSPSHACKVAITDRIDRSNVRRTLRDPCERATWRLLAIIFVGHGDAWRNFRHAIFPRSSLQLWNKLWPTDRWILFLEISRREGERFTHFRVYSNLEFVSISEERSFHLFETIEYK